MKKIDAFHNNIGILKYISILYFFAIVKKMYKELLNFFYFKNQIQLAETEGVLHSNKILCDKNHSQIYFAINLKPEYLLLPESDRHKHEMLIVSNEICKIEVTLAKYQLFDLITFIYERIYNDKHYAYGVICKFKFQDIVKKNIQYVSIYTICLSLLIMYIFNSDYMIDSVLNVGKFIYQFIVNFIQTTI